MDWYGTAVGKTEQLYSQAVTLIGGTTATYGGDGITGVVSAERDGYLITSIPYDENFVLKVDGKETPLFRANMAFLGAKIPSGEHKIVLVYHAPGRAAGSWCSLMGGMLALILVICEKACHPVRPGQRKPSRRQQSDLRRDPWHTGQNLQPRRRKTFSGDTENGPAVRRTAAEGRRTAGADRWWSRDLDIRFWQNW